VQAAEAEREALVQQVAAAKDLAPRLSTAEAQLATAEASLAKVARSSRMFFVVLTATCFLHLASAVERGWLRPGNTSLAEEWMCLHGFSDDLTKQLCLLV
jgi:hypothetical protein